MKTDDGAKFIHKDLPLDENMKKLVKEELSGSESVFGFAGWLTSRDEPTIMSARHECGDIAKLVGEFMDKQDLEEPREHWDDELIPMNPEKKSK